MYPLVRTLAVSLLFASLIVADTTAKSLADENCEVLPFGTGRLWQVSKNGQPDSFVFGTMHSSDKRILFIPGIIMQAFNRSRTIVLETSFRDKSTADGQAMMRKGGNYSLKKQLGQKRFKTLSDIISRDYGIPPQFLDSFKIWSAAAILSQPSPRKKSGNPSTLLDHELEKSGRRMHKDIVALETMKEQLSIFDRMPKTLQIEFLDQALKDYAKLDQEVEQLAKYYLDGNIGAIVCKMQEGLKKASKGLAAVMQDKLITERNFKMVNRMKKSLKKGQAFIAVGALHLPGEKGILSLLEKMGYQVERKY